MNLFLFVKIWEFVTDESGKIEPQCICDISRHQNSVNAVRWSPDGKQLASADTGKILAVHIFKIIKNIFKIINTTVFIIQLVVCVFLSFDTSDFIDTCQIYYFCGITRTKY